MSFVAAALRQSVGGCSKAKHDASTAAMACRCTWASPISPSPAVTAVAGFNGTWAMRGARLSTAHCSGGTVGEGAVGEGGRRAAEPVLGEGLETAYGQVVSAQANFVRVVVDTKYQREEDLLEDRGAGLHEQRAGVAGGTGDTRVELLCVVRAILKKIKQRVHVGDLVRVSGIDWVDRRGAVDAVMPRLSEIRDPSVANVDHVLLMFAAEAPPLEYHNASKFLVAAEASGVPLSLALNKSDLLPDEEIEEMVGQFAEWGYRAIPVSAATGRGVEEIASLLAGRTSVVAGPSGVGKSSFINLIRSGCIGDAPSTVTFKDEDGELTRFGGEGAVGTEMPEGGLELEYEGEGYDLLDVGGVSERTGRGKHTTRHVSLLKLPTGGLLADTPGFNVPSLDGVDPGALESLFPEIRALLSEGSCAFSNCTHVHEPGCAVAVLGEDGEPVWDRYWDYVTLREEVETAEKKARRTGANKARREGNVRKKSGKGGQVEVEAKLDTKKHRRESRRQARMKLRPTEVASGVEDDDDDEHDDHEHGGEDWGPDGHDVERRA